MQVGAIFVKIKRMIHYTPIVSIPIGAFALSTHGLLIATGFLVGVILSRREAQKRGISADLVDNAAVVAVLAGLLGARLVWVLMFGRDMPFLEMLKIWHGGLSSYGGYILGIIAGLVYIKYKKADVIKFADAVMPYLLIGWSIGRIGCFLNWDSFGKITTMPWAMVIAGEARHATQLYESFGYLIAFIIVFKIARSRFFEIKGRGVEAVMSLFCFAAVRFIVDFWRDDVFYYLLMSRIITIAFMASSVVWIVIQYNKYVAERLEK